MRSRRALACPAAVVAAALIPAALLSGTVATTAAYATDSPSPSASAPASSESASPSPSGSESASSSASASPSVPASLSVSEPPADGGQECPSEPGKDDKILKTAISAETNKLVADSVWRNITFKLENRSDVALKGVEVQLRRWALDNAPDPEQQKEVLEYFDLQEWDAKSRTWKGVWWNEVQIGGLLLGTYDVAPHKTTKIAMRVQVGKNIPYGRFPELEHENIGSGDLQARAGGGQGVCSYGDKWLFTIHKPGTDTGGGDGGATSAPTSTPTTGTGGNTPTPQTGTTSPVTPDPTPTGDLAHTGSSSALPVIAGVGAVAVGLGAGAVYVVRRRRSGTEAS